MASRAANIETAVLPVEARPLAVRSYGLTDPGQVRAENEDQYLIAELAPALRVQRASQPQSATRYGSDRGHLFAVADGMGGHSAGEEASALALDVVSDFLLGHFEQFFPGPNADKTALLNELKAAVRLADRRMFDAVHQDADLQGMGTTLTLAYHYRTDLYLAHAGDSRAYLLRDRKLQMLSEDHTVVAEMVRQGMIAPHEAATHKYRHVITNVLGGHDEGVHVELRLVELQPGDALLLCSDGLTDRVPDEFLRDVLEAENDPRAACERLVAEANQRGGEDNITAVVVYFDAPEEAPRAG